MKKLLLAGVTLLSIGVLAPAGAQQAAALSNQKSQASSVQQSQLSRNEIMQAQQALDQKGFKAGKPDGLLGSETKSALIKFQQQQKLQQTGQLDSATLSALGVSQQASPSTTGEGQPEHQSQLQQRPATGSNK